MRSCLNGEPTAATADPSGRFALGTSTGKVIAGRVRFRPHPTDIEARWSAELEGLRAWDLLGGGPVRRLVFRAPEVGPTLAVVGEDPSRILLLAEREEGGLLFTERREVRVELTLPEGEEVTALALDSEGRQLFAGTRSGRLYGWLLDEVAEPVARDLSGLPRLQGAVTAMAVLLGDATLLVGDETGLISAYFEALQPDGTRRFLRVRDFRAHRAPVVALRSSTRNKVFLSVDREGVVAVHHFTSGRTVAETTVVGGPVLGVTLCDRSDWALLQVGPELRLFSIETPHVEATPQDALLSGLV
ncbi:MAG: hypothetical protein KatS3mg115_1650 [Candidatus Poribacteria bacterium]|nr:MAG: hypothetical protein KatS3mg115_1650 [Candidatus Poribacteria bacterium]